MGRVSAAADGQGLTSASEASAATDVALRALLATPAPTAGWGHGSRGAAGDACAGDACAGDACAGDACSSSGSDGTLQV